MPKASPPKLSDKRLTTIHKKITTIENELNTAFLERGEEIQSLIIALIANENVCFVGAPGTGKSELINAFTSLIGGSCFKYQMNQYTQPQDVFGNFSFKELRENDRQILKTANKAPESEIVYLGEAFKANNAMMNSLLLLLNERQVDIGEGVRQSTNNRMIVGDSNEYPEDDELKAFWDRWVVRVEVKDLEHDSSFERFWKGYGAGVIGKVDPKKAIPLKDVDLLRNSLWMVNSDLIYQNIVNLRFELQKRGISLSTRRWGKLKKIIHAVALYQGRFQSTKRDLKFLANCLWDDPSQKNLVVDAINEAMGGELNLANKLFGMADRLYREVMSANLPKGHKAIVVLAPKLDEIKAVVVEVDKLDATDWDVEQIVNQVYSIQNKVAQMISDRLPKGV